jgi:hypothetical protein
MAPMAGVRGPMVGAFEQVNQAFLIDAGQNPLFYRH